MKARYWFTLLPLAVFCALAAYLALALRPGYDPGALPSALLDRPVPDFSLPRLEGGGLEGGTLAPADLGGRVAVVNFFASWCEPCRAEHGVLMHLARDPGIALPHIALIGIAYKDTPEAVRRLLAGAGNPYEAVALDRPGRTAIDFGVYGVPETYVIDASGHIRRRYVGALTPKIVAGDLLPLLRRLGQPQGAPP